MGLAWASMPGVSAGVTVMSSTGVLLLCMQWLPLACFLGPASGQQAFGAPVTRPAVVQHAQDQQRCGRGYPVAEQARGLAQHRPHALHLRRHLCRHRDLQPRRLAPRAAAHPAHAEAGACKPFHEDQGQPAHTWHKLLLVIWAAACGHVLRCRISLQVARRQAVLRSCHACNLVAAPLAEVE